MIKHCVEENTEYMHFLGPIMLIECEAGEFLYLPHDRSTLRKIEIILKSHISKLCRVPRSNFVGGGMTTATVVSFINIAVAASDLTGAFTLNKVEAILPRKTY